MPQLLACLQEERRGTDGDSYFFDLDHFVLMYEDPSVRGSKRMALPPLPFDVAPKPATNDTVETLVLDAATTGARGAPAVWAGSLPFCFQAVLLLVLLLVLHV